MHKENLHENLCSYFGSVFVYKVCVFFFKISIKTIKVTLYLELYITIIIV